MCVFRRFTCVGLVSKDKPRRLLVWNEWHIRVMSEAEVRAELLGQKDAMKPRASNEKNKKEKKSGKKIEAKQRRSKKGSGSGHKKD